MEGLEIKSSIENFVTWANREYIPDELKEKLLVSSILIVPAENLREGYSTIFPVATDKLFRYISANIGLEQSVEICVTDEDYLEYAFFSDYKRLGRFVVKDIALTLFLGLLTNYVYDEFVSTDETIPPTSIVEEKTKTPINKEISDITNQKFMEPTHIKFSITVVDDNGQSTDFDYEGPASEIENVVEAIKKYED